VAKFPALENLHRGWSVCSVRCQLSLPLQAARVGVFTRVLSSH